MKPLKLILKCSNSMLCDKAQLHQSLKNKMRSESASKTINVQSKQATILLPIPPNNISNNTSQSNTQLASCLVDFRRCTSSESHKDIQVCLSEVKSLLKKGNSVIVDVRSEGETWRTGVIPGSLCVPIHQLEKALKMSPEQFLKTYCREKPSTDDHLLFICKRGNRSYWAAKKAKEMGYEKAQSIQDGFIKWLDIQRRIRELQNQSKELDRDSDE